MCNLKRKDSRLRDWNISANLSVGWCPLLEKKRFSITRLKLQHVTRNPMSSNLEAWKEKILDYEIETFDVSKGCLCRIVGLKRKDSRLRDWNLNTGVRYTNCIPKTWKEKILDYEIETSLSPVPVRREPNSLKRKDSRLRDWNFTWWDRPALWGCHILKRKDSRLRDWNGHDTDWRTVKFLDLKRKDSRLRDWNFTTGELHEVADNLKRKDSRLRDWNWFVRQRFRWHRWGLKRKDSRLRDWNANQRNATKRGKPLEKKRFSITRLKPENWNRRTWGLETWKEKILDYEIETWKRGFGGKTPNLLEKKRFSITRLKPRSATLHRSACPPWKEKILDYEIETRRAWYSAYSASDAKLEKKRFSITRLKHFECCCAVVVTSTLEKKRFSITRLKPDIYAWLKRNGFDLKRKDSRLRDWNNNLRSTTCVAIGLEKKRFSITRLKQNIRYSRQPQSYYLEKKRFSITRLKRRDRRNLWRCRTRLEKKRFSITRLKHSKPLPYRCFRIGLKRKDSRLRDWNDWTFDAGASTVTVLKRKASRLRDWNSPLRDSPVSPFRAWKEKILDYEIETDILKQIQDAIDELEKKSISITRLK